jgi:phage terminase small subunit
MDRLTEKQKSFVKDVVNGKLPTDAVKDNYDVTTQSSATTIASRLMDNPKVDQELTKMKEKLSEKLELKGINAEKIAEKIGVLLEAKDKKGKHDYGAIDKGITHAVKIRGDYEAEKHEVIIKTALVRFLNGKGTGTSGSAGGIQETV